MTVVDLMFASMVEKLLATIINITGSLSNFTMHQCTWPKPYHNIGHKSRSQDYFVHPIAIGAY